jgi:hypothetical protein
MKLEYISKYLRILSLRISICLHFILLLQVSTTIDNYFYFIFSSNKSMVFLNKFLFIKVNNFFYIRF